MGAMTNLLVKDDVPTEYTFIPVTDTPQPFWRTAIAGVPLEGQMRSTWSQEQLKNGSWRMSIKTEVPVMETLGASGTSAGYVAPPKVAYVTTVIMTLFADRRSTIADRANAVKIAAGILAGASSTTATGVLNNTSAADTYKNSVLPGPLHMIGPVIPN